MLTDTIHLSWVSTRHFFQSRRRKTPPQILKSGWAEHKRLPIKNKDTIITQLGTSNPSIQDISKIKRVVLTKVYLDEISNHLISTSFEFINFVIAAVSEYLLFLGWHDNIGYGDERLWSNLMHQNTAKIHINISDLGWGSIPGKWIISFKRIMNWGKKLIVYTFIVSQFRQRMRKQDFKVPLIFSCSVSFWPAQSHIKLYLEYKVELVRRQCESKEFTRCLNWKKNTVLVSFDLHVALITGSYLTCDLDPLRAH